MDTEYEYGKDEYGKDLMKIKFDSDDNLPLNKILKLHNLTIVVTSVFQGENKYYPQLFKINVCMSYKNVAISKNWCFRRN